MTLDIIKEIVTVYGPLAMGWVMWYLEKRRHETDSEKREDLLRDALQNSTAAITVLAERLTGYLNKTSNDK